MILFPGSDRKDCGNISRKTEFYVWRARDNNLKTKGGTTMKSTRILLLVAAFSLQAVLAIAEEARIKIVSPDDNERIEVGQEYPLVVECMLDTGVSRVL